MVATNLVPYDDRDDVLKDLGARIRAPGTDGVPFSATAESLQGVSILNMTTQFGDLDVTFSPAGFLAGFESLHSGARAMTVAGLGLRAGNRAIGDPALRRAVN